MAQVAVFATKLLAAYALGRVAQSLATRQTRDGYSEELLGLPVGNTDRGAPRVWAIGQMVRVPAQVMWMEKKVRAPNSSPKKGGGLSVQHVTFDVAFLLNDRLTSGLEMFITNDELLLWKTRNLVFVRTSGMTAANVSGQLVLTMGTLDEDDFADTFVVDDIVELDGWVGTPNINTGYWKVAAVTGHSTVPSTLTLDIYGGQSITSLSVTAGTPFSPAGVTRIDDRIVSHLQTRDLSGNFARIDTSATGYDPSSIWASGEVVEFVGGWSPNTSGYTLFQPSATGFVFQPTWSSSPGTAGTSTNAGVTQAVNPRTVAAGFFPPGFDPVSNFRAGTDDQDEHPIISAYEGVGTIGGFRGSCYQVFDDFDVTNWGGALPPATEALLRVDPRMDWASALLAVMQRGGLTNAEMNVAGMNPGPFLGYYIRGPVSGVQALQPLLLAGQLVTQETNGALYVSAIENAETVQLNNGPSFTDFGAVVNTAPTEKWQWQQIDERDFPSSVGIRFQDPDRAYGLNYEFYGRRYPSATEDEENRQEFDFSTLVLKRKTARNLCTTIARRARINGTTVSFQLPAFYLDLLENDFVTWTDDESNDWLARVVKLSVGANFVLEVQAVLEIEGMGVTGSPVQSGTTPRNQVLPQPAVIRGFLFESPPVKDEWSIAPGMHFAACSAGTQWAGATLFMSLDGGGTFAQAGTLSSQHAIGFLTAAVAAGTPSEAHGSSSLTWDTTNSVEVEFYNQGNFPIVTVTEAIVIDGYNWFAIVDDATHQVVEVFGARDVTVNTSTNLTLSHLLRGLRGTFQGAQAGSAVGLTVVYLSPDLYNVTGSFLSLSGVSTPTALQFKLVPGGEDPANVEAVTLTQRRRNVEPFPIRDFTRTHDAGDDSQTLAWSPWTRKNLPPGTVGPYPLDESKERYVLEIYNPAGSAVVRTFEFEPDEGSNTIRDTFYVYTAADQTTDGYTPGTNPGIWADIRQVGTYATGPSVKQQP